MDSESNDRELPERGSRLIPMRILQKFLHAIRTPGTFQRKRKESQPALTLI